MRRRLSSTQIQPFGLIKGRNLTFSITFKNFQPQLARLRLLSTARAENATSVEHKKMQAKASMALQVSYIWHVSRDGK